jgi:hypothetical protein
MDELEEKYVRYRQNLVESKIHPPKKVTRWEYLALCRAVFGITVLVALYTIYILVGQHTAQGIFSLIDVVESFSGTVLIINGFTVVFSIIAIFLSNRKGFPIATVTLGCAVFIVFIFSGRTIALQ